MEAVEKSNNHVTKYSIESLKKAVLRAERVRKRNRETCLCKNCIFEVAEEVNSWIQFVAEDLGVRELALYEVVYNPQGYLELVAVPYHL